MVVSQGPGPLRERGRERIHIWKPKPEAEQKLWPPPDEKQTPWQPSPQQPERRQEGCRMVPMGKTNCCSRSMVFINVLEKSSGLSPIWPG